jgi:hypothetical protein
MKRMEYQRILEEKEKEEKRCRSAFSWRGTDADLMVKGLENEKYFEIFAEA